MNCKVSFTGLKKALSASVIDQEQVVDHLLIGLLANGNILMEGLPGTAKTRSIKTLAGLIQFLCAPCTFAKKKEEVLNERKAVRSLDRLTGKLNRSAEISLLPFEGG